MCILTLHHLVRIVYIFVFLQFPLSLRSLPDLWPLLIISPPQASSLPAQGLTYMWETRRDTPCCSSLWCFHVTTPVCPRRCPWCSGSTSPTAMTARGMRSASPTASVGVQAWAVGWQGEAVELEARQEGRQSTWTALTAAGRSALWPPSLAPPAHSQSTTRTETSPSSTVRDCVIVCTPAWSSEWHSNLIRRVSRGFFEITKEPCSKCTTVHCKGDILHRFQSWRIVYCVTFAVMCKNHIDSFPISLASALLCTLSENRSF